MRIIEEDSKLGITKVVWKFDQSTDPFEEPSETPADDPRGAESLGSEIPEENGSPKKDACDGTEPMEEVPVTNSPEEAAALTASETHLGDMRQQIRFLQQVIESQNQQLKTKDELIRNFQVLLKTEQEQVLKLEARGAEISQDPKSPTEGPGWLFKLKSMLTKH